MYLRVAITDNLCIDDSTDSLKGYLKGFNWPEHVRPFSEHSTALH